MNTTPWQPYVARYRRGEWRTPIFCDMVLGDARRFRGEATIVDIGCGRGFDLEPDFQIRMARECKTYVGVEPDASAAVAGCFHEVYRTCFEEVPLSARSVDVAYAVMVLEHVRQPERFWTKLWEVLRPGGVFWGFTVDSRHYFASLSYLAERVGMKGLCLRLLHSKLAYEEFEHYATPYLANSPRRISRFTASFRRRDYISFLRVGQQDEYLPAVLRPVGRLIDVGLVATGGPGSILAVRLEK